MLDDQLFEASSEADAADAADAARIFSLRFSFATSLRSNSASEEDSLLEGSSVGGVETFNRFEGLGEGGGDKSDDVPTAGV